ncbi:NERD domain-containing protein [Leucothrix sargassi]|nr:NERD domain-containing protein [Leucothrix sargassi]
MLYKAADCKQSSLDTLQELLERPDLTPKQKKAITHELFMMRAGIKGEKEAAYDLDFHFKDSKNYVVLHDLRLEVNGRVAQIDHLLLGRTLIAYVVETKHFNSGIKINEQGEFLRWNNYQKNFEGMPSPLAQNERHKAVLNDFFKQNEMPKRLGMKMIPKAECYVLVSNNARIDRPQQFDTSRVIKSDAFRETITSAMSSKNAKDTFIEVGRIVSSETLEKIGRLLKNAHKPITIDYLAKFGLSELPVEEVPQPVEVKEEVASYQTEKQQHVCSKCNSTDVSVLSGRYGYYFKCASCKGNTAIKLTCVDKACKPKIRKSGNQFFEKCESCATEKLFFENSKVSEPV